MTKKIHNVQPFLEENTELFNQKIEYVLKKQ